jgi:hypothetical protein
MKTLPISSKGATDCVSPPHPGDNTGSDQQMPDLTIRAATCFLFPGRVSREPLVLLGASGSGEEGMRSEYSVNLRIRNLNLFFYSCRPSTCLSHSRAGEIK